MPLALFAILGTVDLYWFAKQDLLATLGTVHGAQIAASGASDGAVRDYAVRASQGTLRMKDVTVTPCGVRARASTARVTGELYLTPLTPLYEPFWSLIGRLSTPLRYEAFSVMMVDCGEMQA